MCVQTGAGYLLHDSNEIARLPVEIGKENVRQNL